MRAARAVTGFKSLHSHNNTNHNHTTSNDAAAASAAAVAAAAATSPLLPPLKTGGGGLPSCISEKERHPILREVFLALSRTPLSVTSPSAATRPATPASQEALRDAWQSLSVPHAAREAFSASPAAALEEGVREETRRVTHAYAVTRGVLDLVEAREARVATLAAVLRRCPPAAAAAAAHDGYVEALARAVQVLRAVTLQAVEALQVWRAQLGLPTALPFTYRGANYFARCGDDVRGLAACAAAVRFLKPAVLATPLLVAFTGREAEPGATVRQRRLAAAWAVLQGERASAAAADDTAATLRRKQQQAQAACAVADDGMFSSDNDAATPRGLARSPRTPPSLAHGGSSSTGSGGGPTPRSVGDDEGSSSNGGRGAGLLDVCKLLASHSTVGSDAPPSSLVCSTGGGGGGGSVEESEGDACLTPAVRSHSPESQAAPATAAAAEADKTTPAPATAAAASPAAPAPAMSPRRAARAIQVAFRTFHRRSGRRRTARQDRLLNEASAVRRKQEAAELRRLGEERAAAERAAAQAHRDRLDGVRRAAAASALQRCWRRHLTVRAAQALLAARRGARAAAAAAALLGAAARTARVEAARRATRREAQGRYAGRRRAEAAACAAYARATATLRRLAQGCAARQFLAGAKAAADEALRDRLRGRARDAARAWAAKVRARRLRAEQAAGLRALRTAEARLYAAARLQAWCRGCAARRAAAAARAGRALDVSAAQERAARRIQRAVRVAVGRARLARAAEEAAAAACVRRAEELRVWAAAKIYWWWAGRLSAATTRARLARERARRREYVQKVSDRYRRLMDNQSIQMELLAVKLDALLWQPRTKRGNAAGSDSEDSDIDSEEEICVLKALSQHAAPVTRNQRPLAVSLMCARRRRATRLSAADVACLRGFLLGDPVLSGPHALAQLDLTLVARHEDDINQILMNNLLCLDRARLLRLLGGVYGGAPPPIRDTWPAVSVLARVVADWGVHAAVGYLGEAVLREARPDRAAVSYLDLVVGELQLEGSAELLEKMRADPLLLLYSEKLSSPTVRALGTVVPDNADDFLCWTSEMGVLQVLSTQEPELVSEMAGLYGLREEESRDRQEQLLARHVTTYKPAI